MADCEHAGPQTPAACTVAFQAAGNPEELVLQKLLLGINAHINYDLVLTLHEILAPIWETSSLEQRRRRY